MAIKATDKMACRPLEDELRAFFNRSAIARELMEKYTFNITVDKHGQISVYPTPKPEVADAYEGLEAVCGLGCHGPGAIMLEESDFPEPSPKG